MSAWMPIYWGDYFKKTLHLSTFQHGCYLLLIGAYWERGKALPDDPESLARICRTSCDKLARYGNPVLAMFTRKDGLLYHERIENELFKSGNRQAAAIANGRAGGLAKFKLSTTTTTEEKKKPDSSSDAIAPAKRLRKVTSQIPENFPTANDMKAACAHWAGKGRSDLAETVVDEAEAFRAHHLAHGNRMADWGQAWVTWYGRAMKYNKKTGNVGFPSAKILKVV